jgi:hypothetical protein
LNLRTPIMTCCEESSAIIIEDLFINIWVILVAAMLSLDVAEECCCSRIMTFFDFEQRFLREINLAIGTGETG